MSVNKNSRSLYHWIPSPFALAVLLTFITCLAALIFTAPAENTAVKAGEILLWWQKGFWELLKFAMQMMLMLVLGSMIAGTKPFTVMISKVMPFMKNTAHAAFAVSLIAILTAYVNWGLGLILGALLAKKVKEHALVSGIPLNYPLIGAAAYSGLMIWHGGLSGSAPLKVAEPGHFLAELTGVIPVSQTILSPMNIILFFMVVTVIPAAFFFMGKSKKNTSADVLDTTVENIEIKGQDIEMQGLDSKRYFAAAIAVFMLVALLISFISGAASFNINSINMILFAVALLLYGSLKKFAAAASESIPATTGIMLQFPLYAGIMGIMKYSGLTDILTVFFTDISNANTFPLFTMISAGIVNFFVPSGGGQWAVQGPVIMEAAQQLGVPAGKAVMALAYGDQLTNMIQPFWALPLLAITGLKARQILPYSLKIMGVGALLFALVLLLFP